VLPSEAVARPPELNQVLRVRSDGTNETKADAAVLAAQLGMEAADCAASAGIDKQTLFNWKTAGARALAKRADGGRLTKNETAYAEFLDRFQRAQVEFEMGRLANIHRAGSGGAEITETHTTTRRTKAGQVVTETRTVTKTALPQWQADAWLLERRMPAKYRRRVEVTGADGGDLIPPAKRAKTLREDFEDYLAAAAEGAQAAAQVADSTADRADA
jgi:hypothetical protein